MTSVRKFGNRAPSFRPPAIGIVLRGMGTACDIAALRPEESVGHRNSPCAVVSSAPGDGRVRSRSHTLRDGPKRVEQARIRRP